MVGHDRLHPETRGIRDLVIHSILSRDMVVCIMKDDNKSQIRKRKVGFGKSWKHTPWSAIENKEMESFERHDNINAEGHAIHR